MKLIDKRLLFWYIVINLAISSLIVMVLWYTGRFIEGIGFSIKLILRAPSFIILSIVGGINYAMHFARENTFRLVSFIFYSLLIAIIQVFIYKRREKRQRLQK